MSFHVYVEPDLERKLEDFCKNSGRKRNAIVREALKEYMARHTRQNWPEAVFEFKPDAKFRFESYRDDLLLEREDIFANEDQ